MAFGVLLYCLGAGPPTGESRNRSPLRVTNYEPRVTALSTASIIIPATSNPACSMISRIPVGLVTLISVR